MKIKLIIYSKTGNTLLVANKLKDALLPFGHNVTLEQIAVENPNEIDHNKLILSYLPTLDDADVLIFAAPVHAFSLSHPMRLYLKTLTTLNKAHTYLFSTEHFPFKWCGGNRAIRKMTLLCKERDGKIVSTGIIHWSKKDKETQIDLLVKGFVESIQSL